MHSYLEIKSNPQRKLYFSSDKQHVVMLDHYSLNITFEIPSVGRFKYRSYLFLNGSEIELRIFHSGDRTAKNIIRWIFYKGTSGKIKDFALFEPSDQEKRIIGLRIPNSKVVKIKSGAWDNRGYEYFSIYLNEIVIIEPPIEDWVNKGKLYLNNQGFEFVKLFYSLFSHTDNGKFEIPRMKGENAFYKLGDSKFRPAFDFHISDSIDNRNPIIEKLPVMDFKFTSGVGEEEILNYISISCKIVSFYSGLQIDFSRAYLNLEKERVVIHRILENQIKKPITGLQRFLDVQGAHGFLSLEWDKGYLANYKKLNKVISYFVQTRLVDEHSKFLLNFNILEICMSGYSADIPIFKSTVSKKEKNMKYQKAFDLLKETVEDDEIKDFEKRWNDIKKQLRFKTMRKQKEDFLMEQGIPVKTLKIPLSKLNSIRNNVVHGSVDAVNLQELTVANAQLFQINVILILNLLGINNWKWNPY